MLKAKVERVSNFPYQDDVFLRVTNTITTRVSQDEVNKEMERAVREFIQTDEDCQILIREMVKDAFKSINLLEVVKAAVQSEVNKATGAKDNA